MSDDPAAPMPLNYSNPKQLPPVRRWRPRNVLLYSLSVLAGLALLFSCLVPSFGRSREAIQRMKCAANLRSIGQAALMYAGQSQGHLPPDLSILFVEMDVTAEVFLCPSQNDTRAPGATTQAIADSLLAGGHLSYAWAGGGLKAESLDPDVILAFDLENHVPKDGARTTGINAVMGDCTVQFLDEQTAKAVRAQFAAGVRPIRLSVAMGISTQPASR